MKITYSQSYEAKRSRFRRLPKYLQDTFVARAKFQATKMVEFYQDGIRKDFRMEPLQPRTVKEKIRRRYLKPKRPLYTIEDNKGRILLNALEIKKREMSWDVVVSKKRHHSYAKTKLTLHRLLKIHENGSVHRGHYGQLIRIPPRPARLLAYRKMLRYLKSRDDTPELQKAITALINRNSKMVRRIKRRYETEVQNA